MRTLDAVGYAAAALTTASFVPQALLVLRTREVAGISLQMYVAFTAGVALWLAYGLLLGEWPIVVANAVTLSLAATILLTKLRVDAGRRRGEAAGGDPRGVTPAPSPAAPGIPGRASTSPPASRSRRRRRR